MGSCEQTRDIVGKGVEETGEGVDRDEAAERGVTREGAVDIAVDLLRVGRRARAHERDVLLRGDRAHAEQRLPHEPARRRVPRVAHHRTRVLVGDAVLRDELPQRLRRRQVRLPQRRPHRLVRHPVRLQHRTVRRQHLRIAHPTAPSTQQWSRSVIHSPTFFSQKHKKKKRKKKRHTLVSLFFSLKLTQSNCLYCFFTSCVEVGCSLLPPPRHCSSHHDHDHHHRHHCHRRHRHHPLEKEGR